MTRMYRPAWALVILAAGLLTPAAAHAVPQAPQIGWWWLKHKDCPNPSYSPFHYLTPEVCRLKEQHQGLGHGWYHPTLYPDVPGRMVVLKFHCQPSPPVSISYMRELEYQPSPA